MAEEGVFPKESGSILYASEVNNLRFNGYGNLLTGLSPVVSLTSGSWITEPDDFENIYDYDLDTATSYFNLSFSSSATITWTLEKTYNVNKIMIKVKATVGSSNHFKIESSLNGSDWTEMSDFTKSNVSETTFEIESSPTYPAGYMKYIRINMLKDVGGHSKAQIYDFIIEGTSKTI